MRTSTSEHGVLWQPVEMTSFDIYAGIASIVGCLLSLGALIQAGRASARAKEARDAIVLRTLADEFELACVRIDQLTDFISHDRLAEAVIRAQELTSALSEIPYRRSPYLDAGSKNELLDAREEARIIGEFLAARDVSVGTEAKQKLRWRCDEISKTLRKNLGILKREIDRGAEQ